MCVCYIVERCVGPVLQCLASWGICVRTFPPVRLYSMRHHTNNMHYHFVVNRLLLHLNIVMLKINQQQTSDILVACVLCNDTVVTVKLHKHAIHFLVNYTVW